MAATRSSAALLLALALLWGSSWIANSMLVDAGAPLHISVLRYLLACLSIALFLIGRRLVARGQPPTRPGPASCHAHASAAPETVPRIDPSFARAADPPQAWYRIGILLGLSMFAVPGLLLVWADAHGAAAWTPMLYAGLPLGLLLARGQVRSAAILGLGGMLLLLDGSLPVSSGKLLWALPVAAAVALQGWSLLYVRRSPAPASSLACMLVQMLTAVSATELVLRFWPEQAQGSPLQSWPASSLGALCFLAGPATAAAYPLYYRLLERLEPAQLAASAWAQTLIAVAESALLLRQPPGLPRIAAACLLVVCLASMLREEPGEQSGLGLSLV